jgi:hypothetical protein
MFPAAAATDAADWTRARWFVPACVKVRAVTVSGRAPRTVVTVADKTGKGGWCGRLAQVRGVRGHPGAGPRGLTVVVAATARQEQRSEMITG